MGGRLELVDHGKKSLNKGDHGKKSDESSFVCGWCSAWARHFYEGTKFRKNKKTLNQTVVWNTKAVF